MGLSAINIYTFTLPDIVTKTRCKRTLTTTFDTWRHFMWGSQMETRYKSCPFCGETHCLKFFKPSNQKWMMKMLFNASSQQFPTLHCWLPLNVIDGEAIWAPSPSPSPLPTLPFPSFPRTRNQFEKMEAAFCEEQWWIRWQLPHILITSERSFLNQLSGGVGKLGLQSSTLGEFHLVRYLTGTS